jgi:hypothetical protein
MLETPEKIQELQKLYQKAKQRRGTGSIFSMTRFIGGHLSHAYRLVKATKGPVE